MLAMQYSFTLPVDYDMNMIHDQIARIGHLSMPFDHTVPRVDSHG